MSATLFLWELIFSLKNKNNAKVFLKLSDIIDVTKKCNIRIRNVAFFMLYFMTLHREKHFCQSFYIQNISFFTTAICYRTTRQPKRSDSIRFRVIRKEWCLFTLRTAICLLLSWFSFRWQPSFAAIMVYIRNSVPFWQAGRCLMYL